MPGDDDEPSAEAANAALPDTGHGSGPQGGREVAPAGEISFDQIRERAYELWERNHRPEGFEIQFWLLAERELRAERDRRLAGPRGHP